MKKATCVYFVDRIKNQVLMADQQFKIVGTKGYGGKIKPGQTPQESTVEEVGEESGTKKEFRINPDQEGGIVFDPKDLEPVGVIDFYNGPADSVPFGEPSFRVLFYICETFSGTPIDTVEMRNPCMYDIENLPSTLVPGDERFLYDFLHRRYKKGYMRRTEDWKEIIECELHNCTLEDLCI